TNVNLSKIPDGFYTGSYNAIMIAAKVRVDIADHNIQNITILYHKNERGKKAEVIVKEIKSAQSLNVDTITGATNSSRVILKAVQNALDSGVKA
ncbi:MAG: FMN-binding protein, partial [Ethanoligenens sp.]